MENNKNVAYLNHVFHIDLTDQFEGEDYWLEVGSDKYPLEPHTEQTLSAMLKSEPKLQAMPDGALTHFAASVPMQVGTVTRISVRHSNKTGQIPGDFGIHHAAIQIVKDHDENRMLSSQGASVTVAEPIDYVQTAKTLLFHHGDLITTNEKIASIVMEHMDQYLAPSNYREIQRLARDMRSAGRPTKTSGWAHYEDYDAGEFGIKQTLVPTDAIIEAAGTPMTAIQISTKNDTRLQDISWNLEPGTSVEANTRNEAVLLGTVNIAEEQANWRASLSNTNRVAGLQTQISPISSAARQVEVTMSNYYIRWLAAYIQFIDADGKPIKTATWQPGGEPAVANIADRIGLSYDNMRYIGVISPINTFLAIPVGPPGTLTVSISFPVNAVSANIYGCGIGTGNNQYPRTTVIGGVLTGIANLGIPTFFLGLGVAAQTYPRLYAIMSDPEFVATVAGLGVTYLGRNFIHEGVVNKRMDWRSFSFVSQLLFGEACKRVLAWATEEAAGAQLQNQIPFAGWIKVAINITTTVMQMGQTISQVSSSPWMIPNSIATTIDSVLTIHPDPRNRSFPRPPAGSVARYTTKMIYKDQNRPTIISLPITLDPDNYPPTLNVTYANTLGGQVKFEVDFYIDNWLAGKATTAWLPNDEPNAAAVTLYLFQQPIPLNNKSIYRHTSILAFQNNAYRWIQQNTPPDATLYNADNSQGGNAISLWSGLALSQRYGMIGMAWKAAGMGITDCSSGAGGQLNGLGTVSTPGTSMYPKLPGCGFSAPTQMIFDVFPAKFQMKDGQFVIGNDGRPLPDPDDTSLGNYYIDPRKAENDPDKDGGYHLRSVTLDATTPFNMDPDQHSYGRFPYYPNSLTLHPGGYVIGVNREFFKMMITPLAPGDGLADDNIPFALTFAGEARNFNESNGRPGLLFTPMAITCGYDGTILVLEQVATANYKIARVQAFDLNGNPVSCFKDKSGNATPFLALPDNVSYLDIAAVGDDFTTYLYVLYYTGTGSDVNDYNMSLYQYGQTAPEGHLLVTTPKVPAAKINVDMWRTMYTLNYQMTQDGAGNDAGPAGGNGTGPAGVTVPSVSEWLPPVPTDL